MKWPCARSIRDIVHSASGAALAEFALMLPLLTALLAGGIEVSRIVYHYHIASKGVQDAARFLSRNDAVLTGNICATQAASWTTAVTSAKNIAMYGAPSSAGAAILSSWDDGDTITITVSCTSVSNTVSPLSGTTSIPIIEVETNFAYDDMGVLSLVGINNFVITAKHNEMGIGG